MIRLGVIPVSKRIKPWLPENVNVNAKILFHWSSIGAGKYKHNKQNSNETSTHRLLASQTVIHGTRHRKSAPKIYNLDDLKTKLNPQVLESEMDDICNFTVTLMTSEECVQKLNTFLSTSYDSGKNVPAKCDSGNLIRSWLELSLQAHQKFSDLQIKFQTMDPQDPNTIFAFNEEIFQIADTELNVELDPLLQWLSTHQKSVPFEELLCSVLALSFWPNVLTFSQKKTNYYVALTKVQTQLYNLFFILNEASYQRVYVFSSKSLDFYIGDITTRLELAKAWVHAISENNLGVLPRARMSEIGMFSSSESTKCNGSSFPASLIRKVCDKNDWNSRRFFSKFNPEIFVEFAKILGRVKSLNENFHKYYYSYKLFEFLPFLNLSQLSLVCTTALAHGLILNNRHPIGLNISNSIIQKMKDNLDQLNNYNLQPICAYLDQQIICPHQLDSVLQLQTAVADHLMSSASKESSMCSKDEGLNFNSLVSLCSLSIQFCSCSPDLVQAVKTSLQSFFLNKNQFVRHREIQKFVRHREIQKFVQLAQLDVFSAEERTDLLSSASELMRQTNKRFGNGAIIQDRILAQVHMAFNRKFDPETLTDLFMNQKIFTVNKKSNEIRLNSRFLYEDSARSCIIRNSAAILQGMMEIYCPEYEGPKMSPDNFEKAAGWMDVAFPKTFANKGPDFEKTNWTLLGMKILEILGLELQERFDISYDDAVKNYIIETSVLPFFGLTDYVLVLDKDMKPVPLPSEFTNFKLGEIKRPSLVKDKSGFWISLTYVDTMRHILFSKALYHPKPLVLDAMLKIGFQHVHTINLQNYRQQLDDPDLEEEIIGQKLKADVLQVFDLSKPNKSFNLRTLE